MGKKSHILDFSSKSTKSNIRKGTRPLPVLVDQACQLWIDNLQISIKDMLDKADDRLFDMAESGFENTHFDAMRTLRLRKDDLIRKFVSDLKHNFTDNLGKSDLYQSDEDTADQISFENIALVDENELEEGIAVDAIVKKARDANEEALKNILIRLDTLIPYKNIDKENNPFEPVFVCQSFRKATSVLEIDVESLLVVYKLFERSVVVQLDERYAEVNQFFIDKGVLPQLKNTRIIKKQKSPVEADQRAREEANAALAKEKLESLDQQVKAGEQMLSMMQGLLAKSRGAEPNVNAPAPMFETPELVSTLTDIQVQQGKQLNDANVVADLRNILSSHLGGAYQANASGALGQFNEDMIDIISMLFDFILEDKNVHAEIKSVIGRLQIPMLKVGLVDRTFFSNKKHPARRLLNEIGRAGISWDPDNVDAKQVLQKIEHICEEINTNFKDDVSIFDYLIEEFDTFKDQVQKRANIFERRTREAEEGKAKAESARSIVNKQLEKICYKKHIPASAKALLKNVWVHVMFLERLKDSEESWQKVCKLAKLLVWSVQPIKSKDHLEKLKSRIPILIKNLRRGFDIISISPIDATSMLEALEVTHRQIIKDAQEAESEEDDGIIRLEAAPLIPDANGKNTIEAEKDDEPEPIETVEIKEIGFTPEQLGEQEVSASEVSIELTQNSISAVERISAGHWVELKIEGVLTRCKLAAKISSTGKYIFVNRSGVKIAEYFPEGLATEYQLGHLKILDDEALFDRALESVISSLRTMKENA